MSLGMYKVEFQPLRYSGSLEEREIDFLEALRRDDGTYYIDEYEIAELVEAYKEKGELDKVPHDLVEFLRERLKEEGEGFSIIIG